MAKTCQDILNNALALNVANQAFASIAPVEILSQLQYGQGHLFTRLAQENRFFYVNRQVKASTGVGSPRSIDLSALTPPLERLLDKGVVLPDGTPVNIVDFQDTGAEFAPRAYPLGQVLYEVGSEWGAPGVVNLTLVYGYRPADLDTAGALSQAITVPDRFATWLEYALAIYFHSKDVGRGAADPDSLKLLNEAQDDAFEDLRQYIDHAMGPTTRRFILPTSGPAPRKSDKA